MCKQIFFFLSFSYILYNVKFTRYIFLNSDIEVGIEYKPNIPEGKMACRVIDFHNLKKNFSCNVCLEKRSGSADCVERDRYTYSVLYIVSQQLIRTLFEAHIVNNINKQNMIKLGAKAWILRQLQGEWIHFPYYLTWPILGFDGLLFF